MSSVRFGLAVAASDRGIEHTARHNNSLTLQVLFTCLYQPLQSDAAWLLHVDASMLVSKITDVTWLSALPLVDLYLTASRIATGCSPVGSPQLW